MSVLQLTSILSIVLLFVVLRSVRRERIRVEHSVSWLAAAILVLLLSLAHDPLEQLAAFLHLQETWQALLLLVLFVFLGVFYRFSRVVSQLKDMNITLTQRVAILEYQLRTQNEKERA